IVCPSGVCGIVGIKPTVGLISRLGIVPISHSQDTAGPICRTVTDAAILLSALRNPEIDAPDYPAFLDRNGLKGARIGVSRSDFGFNAHVDKLMEDAIDVLKKSGAEVVDPSNVDSTKNIEEAEITVLLYELKADLNAYLASLGPKAPAKTLKEIIDF